MENEHKYLEYVTDKFFSWMITMAEINDKFYFYFPAFHD